MSNSPSPVEEQQALVALSALVRLHGSKASDLEVKKPVVRPLLMGCLSSILALLVSAVVVAAIIGAHENKSPVPGFIMLGAMGIFSVLGYKLSQRSRLAASEAKAEAARSEIRQLATDLYRKHTVIASLVDDPDDLTSAATCQDVCRVLQTRVHGSGTDSGATAAAALSYATSALGSGDRMQAPPSATTNKIDADAETPRVSGDPEAESTTVGAGGGVFVASIGLMPLWRKVRTIFTEEGKPETEDLWAEQRRSCPPAARNAVDCAGRSGMLPDTIIECMPLGSEKVTVATVSRSSPWKYLLIPVLLLPYLIVGLLVTLYVAAPAFGLVTIAERSRGFRRYIRNLYNEGTLVSRIVLGVATWFLCLIVGMFAALACLPGKVASQLFVKPKDWAIVGPRTIILYSGSENVAALVLKAMPVYGRRHRREIRGFYYVDYEEEPSSCTCTVCNARLPLEFVERHLLRVEDPPRGKQAFWEKAIEATETG